MATGVRIIAALMTLLMLMPELLVAAEDNSQLTPVEDFSTAFANDECTISMRLTLKDEAANVDRGTLRWSHSANQRTIARGEVEVRPDDVAGANAEFVLKTPPLRDGVTFTTTVRTEFVPAGAKEAAASHERTLTLFSRDVLAGRRKWAEELKIELYDPEETTAKVFDELGLPYRRVGTVVGDGEANSSGILVVGEGVSLKQRRALMETMIDGAGRGRRVILLAPADGSFVLPGTAGADAEDEPIPTDVRLAGTQIIRELNRKLDSRSWIGTGNVIPSSRLQIQSYRGRVEAAVTQTAPDWPWLRVRYPGTKGTFIVCGFRMIEHWDKGPTPRYLLIRILESLALQSGK